ncbi:hypothetical protein HK102_009205, partial [Quaeritorhiza haematococci]
VVDAEDAEDEVGEKEVEKKVLDDDDDDDVPLAKLQRAHTLKEQHQHQQEANPTLTSGASASDLLVRGEVDTNTDPIEPEEIPPPSPPNPTRASPPTPPNLTSPISDGNENENENGNEDEDEDGDGDKDVTEELQKKANELKGLLVELLEVARVSVRKKAAAAVKAEERRRARA